MKPIDYMAALARGRWWILGLAAAGLVVGLLLPVPGPPPPPLWQTTSVAGVPVDGSAGNLGPLNVGVTTDQMVFESQYLAVDQLAAQLSGLGESADQVRARVSVIPPKALPNGKVEGSYGLVTVTARDTTPARSARLNQAFVSALAIGLTVSDDVGNSITPGHPGPLTGFEVVHPASAATATQVASPSGPHRAGRLEHGAVGLGIGLLLGVAVSLLLEAFDPRVRSVDGAGGAEDMFGIPVVAELTRASPASGAGYRAVRTAASLGVGAVPRRSVVVASARDEPVRHEVALRLAATCADAGHVVIVVTVAPAAPALDAPATDPDDVERDGRAGVTPPSPAEVERELVTSRSRGVFELPLAALVGPGQDLIARIPGVLDTVGRMADTVVVELPLLLAPDGGAAVRGCDGVLVVADPEVRRRDAHRAGRLLVRLGASVIGLVFVSGRPPVEGDRRWMDDAPFAPVRPAPPLVGGAAPGH